MTAQALVEERRALRALLPPAAFRPNRRKLWGGAAHLGLAVALWAIMRRTTSPWLLAALSVAVGHCLFAMALFAHELSHGSVVREGVARRLLELLFWGANMISPTLWRAVHNRGHHRAANTPRDPDRRFAREERTAATWLYTKLFYPHRGLLRRNPLVLLHFLPYVLKHTVAGLAGPRVRIGLVPARVLLVPGERLRIAGELLIIAGLQVALGAACRHAVNYLFAGPLAVCAASAFVMAYVFTNHFTRPVRDTANPVVSTTSVIVSPLVDRIHLHFSYHTEHHLFPSMDSSYYPELGRLLAARAPDRYRRLALREAWRLLWDAPGFEAVDPTDIDVGTSPRQHSAIRQP